MDLRQTSPGDTKIPNSVPTESVLLMSQIERLDSFSGLDQFSNYNQNRAMTQQIELDRSILQNMQEIIAEANQLDSLTCTTPLETKPQKTYPSVADGLKDFAIINPTDEYLLRERKYLDQRRQIIAINLVKEIEKIRNLIPDDRSEISLDGIKQQNNRQKVDYQKFKVKQGKKFIMHFKKVFKTEDKMIEKKIDLFPDILLQHFLFFQQNWMREILEQIKSKIPGLNPKTGINDVESLISNQVILDQLGNDDKPVPVIQNQIDERIFLDQTRKEIREFEMTVFKLAIVIERVNYYTTGLIFVRDQNLNVVPIFDQDMEMNQQRYIPTKIVGSTIQQVVANQFDYQSCLKIIDVLKTQIFRLELIEQQLQNNKVQASPIQNLLPQKDYYFNTVAEQQRKKYEYQQKIQTEESKKTVQTILDKFTGFYQVDPGTLLKIQSQLDPNTKVFLHIAITSMEKNFERDGWKLEQQMYYMPGKAFTQLYPVRGADSWLFTEISFKENLIRNDLVLIFKLYREQKVETFEKERVTSSTKDKVKHKYYRAFAFVNYSDLFIEEGIKCGVTHKLKLLHFYNCQPSQTIEDEYLKISQLIRQKEFNQYSVEITTYFKLSLQSTFLTTTKPFRLQLRMDKSQIVRPKHFWDHMVRSQQLDKMLNFEIRDLYTAQQQELDEFNLMELQSTEFHNQLRVDVRSLTIREKSLRIQGVLRIQVYLYSSDPQARSSINVKFHEDFYCLKEKNSKPILEHRYQTNITALNIGEAKFYNQFFVKLPARPSIKELEKYKLVFLIQFPDDIQRTQAKITEKMIEMEPDRYVFKTRFFAKLPLYDSTTGQVVTVDEKTKVLDLKLFECKLSSTKKNLPEIFDMEMPPLNGIFLSVNLYLISQQYTQSKDVRVIVDSGELLNCKSQAILDNVKLQTHNNILIYFPNILNNLLYMFLQQGTDIRARQDADNIYLAIITIVDRFKLKEMAVYQPLIQEYARKWDGVFGRQNDKKLYQVLLSKIERIQEDLINQLDAPYNKDAMEDMGLVLRHLPTLLNFLLKLFSREFEKLYAEISQLLNKKFRKWLDHDICIYRPDLIERNRHPKRSSVSRPQLVIFYLEEDLKKIQAKYQELIKHQQEKTSNESENDSGSFVQSALESDEFKFSERISEYQSKRSTLNDADVQEREDMKNITRLEQLTSDLKKFHNEFCRKLKSSILQVSQDLNKALDLPPNKKVEFLDVIPTFDKKLQLQLQEFYNKRHVLRQTFWQSLQQMLQSLVNFIDQKFVLSLFDEQFLLHTIEPVLPTVVQSIFPDFEQNFPPKDVLLNDLAKPEIEKLKLLKMQENRDKINVSVEIQRKDSKVIEEIKLDTKAEEIKLEQKFIGEAKKEFQDLVKQAHKTIKEGRDDEEIKIDEQIIQKVLVLSEFIASETFILLPNEIQPMKAMNQESLQEIIAARISKSVYMHLRKFKGAKKLEGNSKDTQTSELTMYFLFKLCEFENNYVENQTQNFLTYQIQDERSHLSVLVQDAMPEELNQQQALETFQKSFANEEEEPLWKGLTKAGEEPLIPNNLTVDDSEDDADILEIKVTTHKSNFQPIIVDKIDTKKPGKNPLTSSLALVRDNSKNNFKPGKPGEKLLESMKQGLGAKPEFGNIKEEEILTLNYSNGQEKRLAYYLRETENIFQRQNELKTNSSFLTIQPIKKLKEKYLSLFYVQTIQHLSFLTQTSFKLFYAKRPGCLDRLVKQVKAAKSTYEFNDHEIFFKLKFLQVIEQFCKNVIDLLCDPINKKFIAEINDKYTYKSIVQQTWVLQLNLWADEAQQLFDFMQSMSIHVKNDKELEDIFNTFLIRVQQHNVMQELLWKNYVDMGDMILPDDNLDIYTGFQSKISQILKSDIDDPNETQVGARIETLLKPLVQVFTQIDELNYKCNKQLNESVYQKFERFIKELVEQENKKNQMTESDWRTQMQKKKLICDKFCSLYDQSIFQLTLQDQNFKELINSRSTEFNQIKNLYLDVVEYEQRRDNSKKTNLLAQLISHYKLMEKLQERNLAVSFSSHIQIKYKTLVDNINDRLRKDYEAEQERARVDEDYVFQKPKVLYEDQMKEVKAFMHVQDYITYKTAFNSGQMKNLGLKQNIDKIIQIIDTAVKTLTPKYGEQGDKQSQPNQFFDVALQLLSDKRSLQEDNYDFAAVQKTLVEQTNLYKQYELFSERPKYCNYYRISMESLLPETIQVEGREFVYKTPTGYNLEFIKDDIGSLLGLETGSLRYNPACKVKPIQPLTSEVRQKYQILKNIKELSDTKSDSIEKIPLKFRSYYLENFKKQFYVEECPNSEPANFKDEYVLTIYEVRHNFPTMTMVQEVYRTFEKKVSRVKINHYVVQQIIIEIQQIIRGDQGRNTQLEGNQQNEEQNKRRDLEALVQKYITNDDVQGGLPKILDLFFNENMAAQFIELDNIELKRAYLELFKTLEMVIQELYKLIEVFAIYGKNSDLTIAASDRLEMRSKDLETRRTIYRLQQLQENF